MQEPEEDVLDLKVVEHDLALVGDLGVVIHVEIGWNDQPRLILIERRLLVETINELLQDFLRRLDRLLTNVSLRMEPRIR